MSESAVLRLVVVGGGVAGVCCVEELEALLDSLGQTSSSEITLIAGRGGFIKTVTHAEKLGETIETFGVQESQATQHFDSGRVRVLLCDVISWNSMDKTLTLSDSSIVRYDKLCIATGATAKCAFKGCPHILTIRDTETVEDLQRRLRSARRVLIVGNGGIATELAFELRSVEIVWVVQHASVSATYFDEAAARFFEAKLSTGRLDAGDVKAEAKRKRYTIVSGDMASSSATVGEGMEATSGCALGPHWLSRLEQGEGLQRIKERKVTVIKEAQLIGVSEQPLPKGEKETGWNVLAELSNGTTVGCDLIIEATGVLPNSQEPWRRDCEKLEVDPDGGILVDEQMLTSVPDVYAAGDVCTARWAESKPHWMQIRLWTQARQMGLFCARSILVPATPQDIVFDLFSHVTTFFGHKRQHHSYKFHYRITEGEEYVKVITNEHKICGAVLIGDTDLEETIENLILNETDISQIEEDLLNPDVDLEDYFD